MPVARSGANLRDDEDELNDRTADRLDDISLGDLSDPSWWESILGSAFDLVMDLTGLDALLDLVAGDRHRRLGGGAVGAARAARPGAA